MSVPAFSLITLITTPTRNKPNTTTVPSTDDGSTGRSPCGLASLPGLRAARAISA